MLTLNKQWQNLSNNSWWNKSFYCCLVDNWIITVPWTKYFLVQKYRLKSLSRGLFSIVNLITLSLTHIRNHVWMMSIHGNRWSPTTTTIVVQPPLFWKRLCCEQMEIGLCYFQGEVSTSSSRFSCMGKLDCVQVYKVPAGNKAGKCVVSRFETCSWSNIGEVRDFTKIQSDSVVYDVCVYSGHRHPMDHHSDRSTGYSITRGHTCL